MSREVIVVEGKDDLAAVKRACQAEVIITNGLGITEETLALIKTAQERCGVIVLTDPDFAGEKIRRIVDSAVPGCRHAFLDPKNRRGKGKPFGVEDAGPEELREALAKAHLSASRRRDPFTLSDLLAYKLCGHPRAASRRAELGKILRIGRTNSKQFLNRLNSFGITREEFTAALDQLGDE